jgi:hypothetical protein
VQLTGGTFIIPIPLLGAGIAGKAGRHKRKHEQEVKVDTFH